MSIIPSGARDLRGLSKAVLAWLIADIAFNFIAIPASLLEMSRPQSGLPDAPLDAIAIFTAVVGVAEIVAFVGCGFVILKWIYRVFRNARVLNTRLTGSPRMAILWYFIPFASLWKPFQLFRDAWQVSVEPSAPLQVGTPPILRGWWALWLANNIIGNLSLRQALHLQTAADVTASDVTAVVGALVSIALDVVFFIIVRRLSDFQMTSLESNTFD